MEAAKLVIGATGSVRFVYLLLLVFLRAQFWPWNSQIVCSSLARVPLSRAQPASYLLPYAHRCAQIEEGLEFEFDNFDHQIGWQTNSKLAIAKCWGRT
jgi:hypothetical protein